MIYIAFAGIASFVLCFTLLHLGLAMGAYCQRKRDQKEQSEQQADLYEAWLKEGHQQHRERLIERSKNAQEERNAKN